jgi:probable phosphoglycerate mutase
MHPSPTRLILIRHGQRHEAEGRYYQHACPGLDPTGVAQALALAARIARQIGPAEEVVLVSNSPPAIQTAQILAGALVVAVAERTCDLCEMDPGAAEGLTPEGMGRRFGPSYQFVPGAEHVLDWLPRAGAGLGRIARSYRGRRILAVTHGGVIKASFVAFGKMPWERASRVDAGNTGITECETAATDDADRPWAPLRHNDVAHLLARADNLMHSS